MTDRKEILSSPEYWVAKTQIDLYNCGESFMRSHGLNRTQLSQHLGVSKGYVSQLLNGDYDHKLSKLVELSLAFGYVPKIEFLPIEEVIKNDEMEYYAPKWRPVKYNISHIPESVRFNSSETYDSPSSHSNPHAA